MKNSTKLLLKKWFLLINTVVIFMILVELSFLIIDDYSRTNGSEIDRSNEQTINIFIQKVSSRTSNLVHLRDINIDDKKIRILNLGDSVTEGYDSNECPDTDDLETLLNSNNDSFSEFSYDVINGGSGGSDSSKILRVLQTSIPIVNPDIVTVFSGWNDHWYKSPTPCEVNNCYKEDKKKVFSFVENIAENNNFRLAEDALNIIEDKVLVNMLYDCKNAFESDPDNFLRNYDSYNTSIYQVSLQEYEANLNKMVDLSEKYGFELIFVVPPSSFENNELPTTMWSILDCSFLDSAAWIDIHTMYLDMIRQVAKERNITLIDLEVEFNRYHNKATFFRGNDFIHPNEFGNSICTMKFYETIKNLNN